MTDDEIELASRFNAAEGDLSEITEFVRVEDTEAESEVCRGQDDVSGCCEHCTDYNTAAVAGDDKVRDFKRFQEIHESGLEVEYRCPRCRECLDCKNADRTEKISIREECEMFAIKQSVHLDYENKRIQCSLPLKGKERNVILFKMLLE